MTILPLSSRVAASGRSPFWLQSTVFHLSSRGYARFPAVVRLSTDHKPFRRNSTSTPNSSSPKPLAHRPNRDLAHSPVNPPSSTLPAPINFPARTAHPNRFGYLWATGKAYGRFYRTGIKHLWTNYKLARDVKARLRGSSAPLVRDPISVRDFKDDGKAKRNMWEEALLKGKLTRGEFWLLERNKHDARRVPVFIVLFIILGEWLPLVAIFFTKLVPGTCRIPKQVEKEARKLEERRKRSFRGEVDGYVADPRSLMPKRDVSAENMTEVQMAHVGRSLGLHSSWWDGLTGMMRVRPPASLLRRKVRRRLGLLEVDDAVVVRDGGVREILEEEVMEACRMRGIDTLGRKLEDVRRDLQKWIKGRNSGGQGQVLRMLLSRPNVWDEGK